MGKKRGGGEKKNTEKSGKNTSIFKVLYVFLGSDKSMVIYEN